ncbi:MAG: DUF928 domain-containing protein [Leptolyngbyaceae cyanobacterium bins.302]|nr:DUF928 domain-containing protein [Leptolyngbyaceae cyanobacterium bins.302]
MITQKLRYQPTATFTTIALWVLIPQLAGAQSVNQPTIQAPPIIFNNPNPPDRGSPTGRQRGGASRGPCRQFEALTALVPVTQGTVWGQTVSDRPAFWFHVPSSLTEKTPIEFVVQDAADNYVYKTRLTAPGTKSGLLQLPMPNTAPPLTVNQPYFWTLSVYCDPNKPSAAVFVKGMIQRVTPDAAFQNRLKNTPALEQARLYAEKGIWYNAVNTLAELYRAKPGDRQLASTWITLLQQTNLGHLTTVPFSSCCTLKR